MQRLLESLSDDSSIVAHLLKSLEAEEIVDLPVLAAVFRDDAIVPQFVQKHVLSEECKSVLMEVITICMDGRTVLTEAGVCDAVDLLRSSREIQCLPTVVGNSAKVRKLEAQARRVLLSQPNPSTSISQIGTVSLQALRDKKKERAIVQCRKLLVRLHSFTPRYARIFSIPPGAQRDAMLRMMDDAYFVNAQPDVVGGYCSNVNCFLDWLKPFCSIEQVTEMEVCTFLRDCRPRGRYVASRHRCALMWCEEVFDVCFFTSDRFVKGQCSLSKGELRASPVQARCPDLDLIHRLEKFCCSSDEPPTFRVMAGLLLCLTHGCLRWSDAQRSLDIILGRHLVSAKATMKRKDILTPWVASRFGFSGLDWGAAFMDLLAQFGMPGGDFMLLEPTSPTSFGSRPASYTSALNYVHSTLIAMGLSPGEALSYTFHGFRQLLPTLASQMGLPELEQEAVGHWKKGSSMPQHYDALHSSLETRAKQRILDGVAGGFMLGKRGEFFGKSPVDSLSNPEPATSSIVLSDSDTHAVSDVNPTPVVGVEYVIPSPLRQRCSGDAVFQVQNSFSLKIHFYTTGKQSVCSWLCGSQSDPTCKADFKPSFDTLCPREHFKFLCERCYTPMVTFLLKDKASIPTYDDLRAEILGQSSGSSSDCDAISHHSDSDSADSS